MAKPVLQTCNAVGNVLTASDLGLSAGTVLATASPKTLTTIQTPVPETLVLLVRQSSGTATYTASVNTVTGYGNADYTTGSVSNTAMTPLVLSTTAASSFVTFRITTSANVIIDRFGVISLSKLTAGEEWRSVRSGRNAVCKDTGSSDASGAWSSDLNVSA